MVEAVKSEKTGSQLSSSKVESLESGSVGPTQRRRESSLVRHLSGISNDVKSDFERPLKATQDEIKWFEWSRRYDRIVDIAHMLEDNGALTPDERAWLVDLGENHYDQYCELGDMLSVSMLSRPGRHGVWWREDRNKVRMQIMKAALHEAMEMTPAGNAYADDSAYASKILAINCALRKAEQVRSAMIQDAGYGNVEAYKYVTSATLQDPRIFYRISNRKHANAALRDAVQQPFGIHSDVSLDDQKKAAKAVEFLVRNDLLEADAAMSLLKALRKKPQHITALMSDMTPRLESKADRQKVRALALLALAYNDGDVAKKMKGDLLTKVDADWREARLDDDASEFDVKSVGLSNADQNNNTVQEKYRRLLDLPSSGSGASQEVRNKWIAWAKSGWAFATESKADIKGDKGGPNVKAGNNNDDPVNDESKKDIDDLPNLIEEEDPKGGNKAGQIPNDQAGNLYKEDVDLSNLPKNKTYRLIDPTAPLPQLRDGDEDSTLDYDVMEHDLHGKRKSAQSLPIVLKLDKNSDDDTKLAEALGALGEQYWPLTDPLGSSPLVQPSDGFKSASSRLAGHLEIFQLSAEFMIDANYEDKAPVTITPAVRNALASTYADAVTARDELASLQRKLNALDVSKQDLDDEKHAAFKKDVATAMDQLAAIIQHTGLIILRLNKAERKQSGSLKSSEDNNDNNNNNNSAV